MWKGWLVVLFFVVVVLFHIAATAGMALIHRCRISLKEWCEKKNIKMLASILQISEHLSGNTPQLEDSGRNRTQDNPEAQDTIPCSYY